MTDDTLDALVRERRHLLGLGYRLTGSIAEAEDVVQETYARWYALTPEQRDAVQSPAAWLTTVASRICLDLLGSARVRRERYIGEWLPEPVPDGLDAPADPADRVTLDESLSMAFLVVLEEMTPAERVSFILHDVFHYSFAEIADILGRSPAASRQLASSARKRARMRRPDATTTTDHSAVVRRLRLAWEANDIVAIVGLLDPDATLIADGGGVASAALHPITGADAIARYFLRIAQLGGDLTVRECTVNGGAGLVAERDGVAVTVVAFEFTGERIERIWAVRNPRKLRPWTAEG